MYLSANNCDLWCPSSFASESSSICFYFHFINVNKPPYDWENILDFMKIYDMILFLEINYYYYSILIYEISNDVI
jgi:hypothetical protein